MTISVVSLSHEPFSLWDGETAWELETTLFGCTCRALQNHPLKSLALPWQHTAWRWQGRARSRDQGSAGQRRAERVSRSSHSSSFG